MTPHDVLLGLPVDLSWRSLPRTYATSLLLLTGITPRSIATLGGGSNWTNAAWNARILLATERISESCLSVVRAAVGGIVVEGRRRGGRGLQHVEVDWFFLLRWAAANDAAELIEALIGATESDPGLVPLSKPINIPSTFTMPDDIIAPSTSDVLPRALEDAFLTSVYLNRPRVAGYFLHSRPALISPACDDQRAIKMAASHGHVEITRMLVDDERVDLFSDRCYALRWATSKRFDGIKGMLEKGMRERRERAAAMNASAIVV
ncbi:hypothetical protein HK101_003649 [Irineochytrium annulatum]|nr:hypothetical protein HK101_003649 [Irineochytrium annulatum]